MPNPEYDFDENNLDKIEVWINGVLRTDVKVDYYNKYWRCINIIIPVTVKSSSETSEEASSETSEEADGSENPEESENSPEASKEESKEKNTEENSKENKNEKTSNGSKKSTILLIALAVLGVVAIVEAVIIATKKKS